MAQVTIFLSTVSAEFSDYRNSLRHGLDRPNVTVKIQEDFIATGAETLIKLDDYIRECDLVVHLVGDMTGAMAKPPSVAAILNRYSDFAKHFPSLEPFLEQGGPALPYTQWEAWLALYHNRELIIAVPKNDAPRDERYQWIEEQSVAQQGHLARLKGYERYAGFSFASIDNLASELWRSTLHDIIPQLQPPTAELERVREMASALLDVGRVTWKMPRFVAPLNLEVQDEKAESKYHPTSKDALTEAVSMGENIVLFGEGGIGKTTFLLELSDALLSKKCPRIPLYVDAAYWARTNMSILEYVASCTAAQQHGVTTNDIARLAETGCLTLVVNGWNEISSSQKFVCFGRFTDLIATTPDLNIVVVSRSLTDAPSLKTAKQIHVRGLSWQGQMDVMHSELDEGTAIELIELLARETQLRYSARSPLILKGVIAMAKKGQIASSSIFDLLSASVDAFEEDDQRRLALSEQPVRNQHGHFLEALASHLTAKQETTTSIQEVLPVFSATAKQLYDAGQYGGPPDLGEILVVLSNHHLLHNDGQIVRFAHQRFQEYFTAKQLLDVCVSGDKDNISLLREAINQPFWEDALRLVGGKLKGLDGYTLARGLLVRMALDVDLGFACDLAGVCAFSETDDKDLFRGMVSKINVLCNSPFQEVVNYGLVCLTASGFTVLADRLWSLLESDDREIRLDTYRLSGEGISLKQLGESAEARMSKWLPDRRVESMHDLAENPDNYDFIVRTANEAVEDEIRVAAIAALAWSFPASEAAAQAWLKASPTVQLAHEVTYVIKDALKYGVAADEVRERLRCLMLKNATNEVQLRLARVFPDEVGEYAVEAMSAELPKINRQYYAETEMALAMKHAPDKLKVLARELVLSERVVPDWASKFVQEESAEFRTEVFEAAWAILHGDDAQHLSAKAVGVLASRVQTLRSVREWLDYCQDRRADLSDDERERGRQLGYLLANAPGDDLLSVVLEIGNSASYQEVSELLDLVLTRTRLDSGRSSEMTQWLPCLEDLRTLIDSLEKQSDDETVPQHRVHILLCSIASRVAPAEFGDFLLDGCRLYLDAWERFYVVHGEWIKSKIGRRPSNPYLGNYLISAMENWGFGALPGVLELLVHPQANQLIPAVVGRIVSQPWASKEKGLFRTLGVDFKTGEDRRLAGRVLLQPNDTHQEMTDIAARALCTKLTELVKQLRSEQAESREEWNIKNAAYRMRGLLNTVASMPSPEIVEPLMYALANGYIDAYSAVDALKGLICQGVFIEDVAVVLRIEALYADEASAGWLDDSARHILTDLCQLMYFVRPETILSKPLSDYLVEWQRHANIYEIIRRLEETQSVRAWGSLLILGKTAALKKRGYEELVYALASTFSSDNFSEFLNLITEGILFTWAGSDWNLKRIAPDVLRVIGDDTTSLNAFLEVCENSSSPFADGFACAVISLIPEGDSICVQYGLSALDVGKVSSSHSSVYSMLQSMFTFHEPLDGEGQYEVHPKSCNELRHHIYNRAKEIGIAATISRSLLAEVECMRREGGRPTDEPRHPASGDNVAWTEVLSIYE